MVRTLQQYLNPQADERRFNWLYFECPYGRARTWVAREGAAEIMGIAAAFPRHVYTPDGRAMVWVLGDFCIAPRHRSMGAALQLQRACLAGLGEDAGWYDFPSASMAAIYRRLGVEPQHNLVRMAKRLRVDDKLATRLGNRALARILAAPVNLLLRARVRQQVARGLVVDLHAGSFGAEFSALADAVGAGNGVCVRRSAEFLNWRYRAHPLVRYEALAARRKGALLAYAVFACTDAEMRIVDLFGSVEPETITGLITTLGELALRRGLHVIHAPLLAPEPLVGLLRSLGFWVRDSAPVMIGHRPSAQGCEAWFLCDGDRES